MSRYIDADAFLKEYCEPYPHVFMAMSKAMAEAPSIDLDDYVPKDFHDKTCEAMAKVHQEEIADMVRVVRCKECKWWVVAMDENNSDEDYLKCPMDKWPNTDDFCSYGERSK